MSGNSVILKLALVAWLDARLTGEQKDAGSIPPGLAALFHGD